MLTHLHIRDFLLVDQMELTPQAGLNILTGETGAGKSLLLDALALTCGDRADSSQVRPGAKQARLTACFEMPPEHPVWEKLTHHGVVPDDILVLGRVIESSGKSRAFVNDQPVTAALLKALGSVLVLMSGQFAAQDLLSPDLHREALDRFHEHDALVAGTAQAWQRWQEALRHLEALRAEQQQAQRDQDYWEHAEQELAALAPQPSEESTLLDERHALATRARGAEGATKVLHALTQPDLCRQIYSAQRKLEAGHEAIDSLLEQAAALLTEACGQLETLAGSAAQEQQQLEKQDDRLHLLRAAARKYQVPADDLAGFLADIQEKQERRQRLQHTEADAQRAVHAAQQQYQQQATQLSSVRTQAAQRFQERVEHELQALKMPGCRFRVVVEPLPETLWQSAGCEQVIFQVQTNPGMPFAPVHKAASGGELSRLMLALRVVLHTTHPVLIFDEIDSGVGGAVASAIGARLAALGQKAQVLTITHSPQVAARGQAHWHLRKQTAADGLTTRSHVTLLDRADRQEELARMLAGETVGEEARQAAQRLLHEGQG